MATYGHTKKGKTNMAGTFPHPFFFSFGVESGIASLSSAANEAHYVSINSIQETQDAVSWFRENYEKREYRTAVVDTVTLLGRMVEMELTKHGEIPMEFTGWAKYLAFFLKLRDALHSCNVHVVWVFHVDEVMSGDVLVRMRPKLAGKARQEILQCCGIIAYQDTIEVDAEYNEQGQLVKPARTAYRLFTRCPENARVKFEVGTWYDKVLTSQVYYPSFDALAEHLAPRDEKGAPKGVQHITI